MSSIRKGCLLVAAASLLAALFGLLAGAPGLWQSSAAAASLALAVGLGALPALAGYQFTAWILAAVVCALIYPARFLQIGPLDTRSPGLILLVVQLVMFGMGTQMSLSDFMGVIRMPRGVIIGLLCQFTVMPLVGYGLAHGLEFPPEVAAGIVLIGSCSSGLASNVMAHLSGARLALSVTLTACATLLAPILTPFWMTRLAGEFVEVDFLDMMLQIVKIVLVPVGAALLHDYLSFASARGRRVVGGLVAAGLMAIGLQIAGGAAWIESRLAGGGEADAGRARALLEACAQILGAFPVGFAYHHLTRRWESISRCMPGISMAGIVYFTTVTTAAGRDQLLAIGPLLLLAAVAHNTAGYALGYWLSRLSGLDRRSARTIAFEVGLQNGGMASGLAGAMGKLGTVGLAAAIFSPWMNISGSLLANFWKRRPAE